MKLWWSRLRRADEVTEPLTVDKPEPWLTRRFGSPSPRAILAAVGFSVFIAADDLTVVSTMLRPIIGDLGLALPDGLDDAAWIVNVYLIAFVAAMPISGRLSDIVGRRQTFVAAYMLFAVGTIIIPLSSSLGPFLVGRVFTAVGGGAMVPVALAVVGDIYTERDRSRALGTLGAIETLGWVWGPIYGALLVRFLSWRWQFWLNVPLAIVGLVAVWWALAEHDRKRVRPRFDWVGATSITVGLVALNLALLGNAEIQSVTGLEELTGSGGPDFRWLYIVAALSMVLFVWHQRRSDDPLISSSVLSGRNVRIALIVNFVVGSALVIAMVDVPLFVNAVEVDIERSAIIAGSVLSALTAAMAITSYLGGRLTERTWYQPPVVTGMGLTAGAYLVMGLTWNAGTSHLGLAAQLAVLGAGLGFVIAPTTTAVVDAAAPADRGAAASLVMVIRLTGFSVGLSALTAWGLARFNQLRGTIDLPSILDPEFEPALRAAQETLTATIIADTFLASALVAAVGLIAALAMRKDATSVVANKSTGVQMGTWLHRNLAVVLGVFAAVLLAAIVAIAMLFSRLQETRADLDMAEEDFARVEAGAALFASQVQGFQERLVGLAPTVSSGLDEAIVGLDSFGSSTLVFTVSIDEVVTINTEVVIDRVIEIPISETIPINETFETTIEIDGPLGLTIPLDVSVPVNIEVPLDLNLSIPVKETIPISAEVPVKLDVPIEVDVADTELARLTESLAAGLASFKDLLDGLG